MRSTDNLDIQGHRGCRGLLPENTIPAFAKAVDLGVTTLECDVVVSKDKKIIMSHEPWFSHEIASDPNGNLISKEDEKNHNLYALSYEEIKTYDVGLRPHSRFENQEKIAVSKPSLEDMVVHIENKTIAENKTPIQYNIELKRKPEHDNIFHPNVFEFADLTVQTVRKLGIEKRTSLQCFDVECLQFLHQNAPEIDLAYLIENWNSIEENIEILGFVPAIYSPHYKLVNKTVVDYCKKNNMRLIPWTINEEQDMIDMINLGVDGIISDYPDVLLELIARQKS